MELDFINNGPKKYDQYEKLYNELLKETFNFLKIENNYTVDVSIVNNEEIHRVNNEYRNIDRPTDVISFAYFDDKNEFKSNSKDIPCPLGAIIVSYEKAEEQAMDYGHSIEREMSFLLVHGLLHLLGYDHIKKEDEKIMFDLQDKILGER